MTTENKLTKKIKRLIKKAPTDWASIVGGKMDVSRDAVYRYVKGERGKRDGLQVEVYNHLVELIAFENERKNRKLL